MAKHVQSECFNGVGGKYGCDDCYACHLAVCSVCNAYEGSLTTDCPGEKVSMDIQDLVYNHNVNYSDELGWHLDTTGIWERKTHFAPQKKEKPTQQLQT